MQATTNLKPIKCSHLIGETNKQKQAKQEQTPINTPKHHQTQRHLLVLNPLANYTTKDFTNKKNTKKWNKIPMKFRQTNFSKSNGEN
jgi:hypothetical protein